jgi:formate dehydrogenase subunit gamma
MTTEYDKTVATEIIDGFAARPEMLVQILRAFVVRFSYLCEDAIRQISSELNLSRAEVWGVTRFYHDFRTEPPGKTVVKICQAEACQAMGSRELTAHAEKSLGLKMPSNSSDGNHTLEAVYCLGNCACSPAVMIDERVYGRVDAERFDSLVKSAGTK